MLKYGHYLSPFFSMQETIPQQQPFSIGIDSSKPHSGSRLFPPHSSSDISSDVSSVSEDYLSSLGKGLQDYVLAVRSTVRDIMDALTDVSNYRHEWLFDSDKQVHGGTGAYSLTEIADKVLTQKGVDPKAAKMITHPFHWFMRDHNFVEEKQSCVTPFEIQQYAEDNGNDLEGGAHSLFPIRWDINLGKFNGDRKKDVERLTDMFMGEYGSLFAAKMYAEMNPHPIHK